MNPVQQALIRKIESDRQLAIYVDNAMVGVQEVAYDTTEVIGLGFDRTVKHFSYFLVVMKMLMRRLLRKTNDFLNH